MVLPYQGSRTPFRILNFYFRSGPLTLLSLGSLGFSPFEAYGKSISLISVTLSLFLHEILANPTSRSLRVSSASPGSISLINQGADPSDLLYLLTSAIFSKGLPACGLFFHLKGPRFLTKHQCLIFAADFLLPNGRWHTVRCT